MIIMDKRKRTIKLIKEIAFVAVILAANAIIYTTTGYGIPCIFRLTTGLKCPGCGMTHAYIELCKGNLHGALGHNILSVTLMPLILIYLVYKALVFIKTGEQRTRAWEYVAYTICFIVLALFFVYRNFYPHLGNYHL